MVVIESQASQVSMLSNQFKAISWGDDSDNVKEPETFCTAVLTSRGREKSMAQE